MPATILLIAPREEPALLLRDLLRGAGHAVRRAASLDPDHDHDALDLVLIDDPPGGPLARALPDWPRPVAPLLFLTDDEPTPSLPGDAAVFLRRPVSPAQLLGQVGALLRLAAAERGLAADAGGRQKTELALRDSEALYHSLVEALPVCLFRKDLAGRFSFVNVPFAREVGRRPEEVHGHTDQDFYPEDLAAKYVTDDRRVLASGQTFECVEQNATPEGHRRFVHVIKTPLRDAAGQLIGVQGIFWDVTARLHAEQELARTIADMHYARRVQQRLFPAPRAPLIVEAEGHGIDLAGASYPVDPVGGDYFDFFRLGEAGLGVAIGDVAGHGLAPSLLMAAARAYLRASAPLTAPGEVLSHVNSLLADDVEGDRFITLLLVRLDPVTREMSYASAGHATGYVLDATGEIKRSLPSTGVPLCIHAQEVFATHDAGRLEDGDLVVLLTDGITEARDPDRNGFTQGRVLDLVRAYRHAPAREIVENLYHAVRAFAQNLPQLDDITATVIKARGLAPTAGWAGV